MSLKDNIFNEFVVEICELMVELYGHKDNVPIDLTNYLESVQLDEVESLDEVVITVKRLVGG